MSAREKCKSNVVQCGVNVLCFSNVNSYARYLGLQCKAKHLRRRLGPRRKRAIFVETGRYVRTCNYCLHAISPSSTLLSLIFHNDFIHIIFTAFRREIVPASYRFTQERTTRVPMLATVKLVSKTIKNITHYKELSTLKM